MRKFINEKWQKIIKALSFLIIGLIFVFVPGAALSITLRIVGGLLLVYEILEIYEIIKAYRTSPMLALLLINELFPTLLAIMLLVNPLGAVRTLALIAGIYFLIFGGISLYRAVNGKNTRSVVLSSVSLAVGLLLLVLPHVFADLVTIILGVALIIKSINLLLPLIGSRNGKDDENYYM